MQIIPSMAVFRKAGEDWMLSVHPGPGMPDPGRCSLFGLLLFLSDFHAGSDEAEHTDRCEIIQLLRTADRFFNLHR